MFDAQLIRLFFVNCFGGKDINDRLNVSVSFEMPYFRNILDLVKDITIRPRRNTTLE